MWCPFVLQIFLKVAEDSGVDSVELSGECGVGSSIMYLVLWLYFLVYLLEE